MTSAESDPLRGGRAAEALGKVRHPVFARFDAWFADRRERLGGEAHQRELLAGTRGRVIEIGAGAGLSFGRYPPDVKAVVAVEPEPYLRARARQAGIGATIPVVVIDGVVEALPAADEAFDFAIVSTVLCSVRNPIDALQKIRRVLRPGGELRFWEHVRSHVPALAAVQRSLDVFWPTFVGGCHTSRDTETLIRASGLDVVSCRQFTFRPCIALAPVAPMILGAARRPESRP